MTTPDADPAGTPAIESLNPWRRGGAMTYVSKRRKLEDQVRSKCPDFDDPQVAAAVEALYREWCVERTQRGVAAKRAKLAAILAERQAQEARQTL